MTNETKTIAGFNCFKALLDEDGYTVEAWFAPELAVSSGPMHYNGLPGLILELTNRQAVLTAIKITLNPKGKLNLEKPTKGNTVTKKEFNSIARRVFPPELFEAKNKN